MTVYEMIKELTQYPSDATISLQVIGEKLNPLNIHEDGMVDIDEFSLFGRISTHPAMYGTNKIVVLEVEAGE